MVSTSYVSFPDETLYDAPKQFVQEILTLCDILDNFDIREIDDIRIGHWVIKKRTTNTQPERNNSDSTGD